MARRANGEGTIYFESSSGRWVGAISVDGKRRKVKGRTRDEVRRRLDLLKRDRLDGRPIGDGNMTLQQLIEVYEQKGLTSRERRSSTIDVHRWALARTAELIGSKRLRSLTVEDVEDALDRAAGDGLSRGSLIKMRSVLGQLLAFGERRSLVSRNVSRLAELPPNAPRQREGRAFTVAQARTFMRAAEGDRLEALWLVMLGAGLRPGEAAGLTWDDIDLRHGRLRIRRSLKLDGGQFMLDERLKTSRSRRTLDAPPFVMASLRAHKRRQAQERLAAGSVWSGEWDSLVFTTRVGTPLSATHVRKLLASVTQSAGLGRWHPHELRHSAASILSASGVPLEHVADVLGHDGVRMTALVYRHSITPSVTAAAGPMQDALGGP